MSGEWRNGLPTEDVGIFDFRSRHDRHVTAQVRLVGTTGEGLAVLSDGSSVPGWLTKAGERLLALMREAKQREHAARLRSRLPERDGGTGA